MKPYYYFLRLVALIALIAVLAVPSGLVAASAIPGLLIVTAALTGISWAIKPLVLVAAERPQRPSGPDWSWQQNSKRWLRMPGAGIEDEIDAAVAAWKTVYGEDVGFNEHAVTLEWLGSLHRTNDLSSDQLADCADSVEWITWALKQPEQNEMRSPVAPRLSCGCSETHSNANCRHVLDEKLEQQQAAIAMLAADRRIDYRTFERLRAQLNARSDSHDLAVLEAGCDSCATETVRDAQGFALKEFRYCDGSHTREQSLADTIPETYNDWR